MTIQATPDSSAPADPDRPEGAIGALADAGQTLLPGSPGQTARFERITYYYRRKEDLAAACLMRSIGALDGLLTEADAASSAPERLRLFLRLYFALLADMAEGRAPALINFWDLRALTGPQALEAMAAFVALFRRLRQLFRAPSGPVFTGAEQNARAHLVFSALLRAREWVTRYAPEDYARAAERLADVLIGGLAVEGAVWAPEPLELWRSPGSDRGEVSREAFLQAATRLLNDDGYRAASVDRISARLKVSKGSFYHHNTTKDELVSACFNRTFEMMRQAHRRAEALHGSGWTRLTAMTAALVRHQLSAHGPLLRISALSAAPQVMRQVLVCEFSKFAVRPAGLFAVGGADGSVRPVDPVIAAQLLSGVVNAAAELVKWSPIATEDTAARLFARPLFLGLFSPGSRNG